MTCAMCAGRVETALLKVPGVLGAVGIPLAAAGLLSPVIAGAAMAMSSFCVVSNALLLRRWKGAGT